MLNKLKIINLEGINWESHIVIAGETFLDCVKAGAIEIDDTVMVENNKECTYKLNENEYLLTFDKKLSNGNNFFIEEPFTLEECRILFGKNFNY